MSYSEASVKSLHALCSRWSVDELLCWIPEKKQKDVWRDMLEGTTRLVVTTTKVKKKEYERFLIHIPSKVARDSQFPFASGDVLEIEVNPRKHTIVLSKPPPTKATRTRKRS